MRNPRWIETAGALFLIGAGIIFLLQELDRLGRGAPLVWSLLLGGGGLLFLLAYFVEHAPWWTLIPGSAMVGAGASAFLGGVLHAPGTVAGAAFPACLAACFVGIFLDARRQNWWALIPAGVLAFAALETLVSGIGHGEWGGALFFLAGAAVFFLLFSIEIEGRRYSWWTLIPAGTMLSLAAMILLSPALPGSVVAAILFGGLGLTFGLLYVLPGQRQQWAWVPAVALVAFALFIVAAAGEVRYARLFWPLGLLAAGVALLIVTWRRGRPQA